jgi:hypothetical protein
MGEKRKVIADFGLQILDRQHIAISNLKSAI